MKRKSSKRFSNKMAKRRKVQEEEKEEKEREEEKEEEVKETMLSCKRLQLDHRFDTELANMLASYIEQEDVFIRLSLPQNAILIQNCDDFELNLDELENEIQNLWNSDSNSESETDAEAKLVNSQSQVDNDSKVDKVSNVLEIASDIEDNSVAEKSNQKDAQINSISEICNKSQDEANSVAKISSDPEEIKEKCVPKLFKSNSKNELFAATKFVNSPSQVSEIVSDIEDNSVDETSNQKESQVESISEICNESQDKANSVAKISNDPEEIKDKCVPNCCKDIPNVPKIFNESEETAISHQQDEDTEHSSAFKITEASNVQTISKLASEMKATPSSSNANPIIPSEKVASSSSQGNQCPKCLRFFVGNLQIHRRRTAKYGYNCCWCPELFYVQCDLIWHVRELHGYLPKSHLGPRYIRPGQFVKIAEQNNINSNVVAEPKIDSKTACEVQAEATTSNESLWHAPVQQSYFPNGPQIALHSETYPMANNQINPGTMNPTLGDTNSAIHEGFRIENQIMNHQMTNNSHSTRFTLNPKEGYQLNPLVVNTTNPTNPIAGNQSWTIQESYPLTNYTNQLTISNPIESIHNTNTNQYWLQSNSTIPNPTNPIIQPEIPIQQMTYSNPGYFAANQINFPGISENNNQINANYYWPTSFNQPNIPETTQNYWFDQSINLNQSNQIIPPNQWSEANNSLSQLHNFLDNFKF